MISATLTVAKDAVMEEVMKTTSYAGKKTDEAVPLQEGQESAYDRMRATEYDKEQLARFWDEATSMATGRMSRWIKCVTNDTSYTAELSLSSRWEEHLQPSMQASLFSFFVSFIIARWFTLSAKEDADTYMAAANTMLDDVMRKIYHRSAPERVEPIDN